eukprot:s19_g54.t1
MDRTAAGAFGSTAQTAKVVITQPQPAATTHSYSLATTLGELVNRARSSAAGTAVIEKIEVQLSPPKDPLLTTDEQNLLGGVIMQIYEERLVASGENLAVQEVHDQSVKVREGILQFLNSFTAKELVEMSQFAHFQEEEPAPMS